MKKLMFAVAAILMISLTSCRNNDIENVQEEIFVEKLKANEDSPKTMSRDTLSPNPATGVGPIVVTPPR